MDINLKTMSEIILRLMGRNPKYHGTIVMKFYNGEISNVKMEDSLDLEKLKNINFEIKVGEKNV